MGSVRLCGMVCSLFVNFIHGLEREVVCGSARYRDEGVPEVVIASVDGG